MLEVFVNSAVGEPVAVDTPYESSAEYYLVRDLDMTPGVFSLAELVRDGAPNPLPVVSPS